MASATKTERRLIAIRDLAEGTDLAASDVAYADVRVPSPNRYAAALDEVVGRTLRYALRRGEVVSKSSVLVAPASTSVTVPLAAGTAPSLSHGDRVALWLSTASCAAQVLVDGAVVQSARSSSGYTGEGGQEVELSLAPDLAARVVEALAIPNSTIRAGVEYGSTASGSPDLSLAPCETTASSS